jgi:hypothetical protein
MRFTPTEQELEIEKETENTLRAVKLLMEISEKYNLQLNDLIKLQWQNLEEYKKFARK